ncbi:type II toxin-antitoxin system RelE family toxin [Cellulosimicrobium cellulans]|uniref:type II toxin-antitoxin system RelE family toxin n=1 Tax=Cellulosimicrobium cellulans TaxID=1710 RepID=UPI00130D9D75|nr:type II toxin-antitoxin system RelE/ParE family toxin [Cellulosimicrobium cellulans]
MYEVRFAPPAVRAIDRLPPKLADAVLRFCRERLAENPHRSTKPLVGRLAGERSGYVGIGFRVIVRVDEEHQQVHVLRMGPRADVYR